MGECANKHCKTHQHNTLIPSTTTDHSQTDHKATPGFAWRAQQVTYDGAEASTRPRPAELQYWKNVLLFTLNKTHESHAFSCTRSPEVVCVANVKSAVYLDSSALGHISWFSKQWFCWLLVNIVATSKTKSFTNVCIKLDSFAFINRHSTIIHTVVALIDVPFM